MTRDNFILCLSAHLSEANVREPITEAARYVLAHPDIEHDTTPEDAAQEWLGALKAPLLPETGLKRALAEIAQLASDCRSDMQGRLGDSEHRRAFDVLGNIAQRASALSE